MFLKRFLSISISEVISIYSFWICINSATPDGYEMLWLLPLSFAVLNGVLLYNILDEEFLKNIPALIAIALLFIRNVITPLAMVNDSFVSSLGIASADNAKNAIILIVYETIIFYIFIAITSKYTFKAIISKNIIIGLNKSEIIFKFIMYGMLLIGVLALVALPALRSQYYTIFTHDITHIVQEEVTYTGSAISRVLATGGDICISTIRYIFPIYVIYKLSLRSQTIRNLILSLLLVFAQCLFMNDSNAYILMLMLSQFLFVIKVFPQYRKLLAVCIVCFGVSFLLILYINRFALDHYGASISLFLQSYIPGIANTAGIFKTPLEHNFLQLFKDIYAAIPFKNFIGLSVNVESTADIWKASNNSYGQIMSTVAQSYYIFGAVLSPLISCFLYNIARKCNASLREQNNVLMYSVLIYLMLLAVVSPFAYNGCIFLKNFFQRVVFLWIVAYFSPYEFYQLNDCSDVPDAPVQ